MPETAELELAPVQPDEPPMESHETDWLEVELKAIEQLRQNTIGLRPIYEAAKAIAGRFPMCADYHVSGGNNGVWLRYNLDSMKDVVPVLEEIVRSGFRPAGHNDYPEDKRRTYDYTKDGKGLFVNVQLPYSGEGKCSFRQTGVKEVPTYELVCE